MSKHTDELQRLGELTLNDWLAVGTKLGGAAQVRKLQSCDVVTVEFATAKKTAVVTAELPAKTTLLHPGKIVLLPAQTNPFDPKNSTTVDGLYVSRGYTNRILSVAQPVESLLETSIVSCDLAHNGTDTQIRAELPDNHVWEASEFAARLNGMIRLQWVGTAGVLLNNDYANIFYVCGTDSEVFAVFVRWCADGRRWRVIAYTLDDGQWLAGRRVFSRTAAAQALGSVVL